MFLTAHQPARDAVMLLCLACLLPACSQDKHVFRSTIFTPTTISLWDIPNGETIWTKDIPVGYQLVMNLDRDYDLMAIRIGSMPAQRMSWSIQRIEGFKTLERGRMKLPGVPVIIKRSHRPAPEYPPEYLPSPRPPITETGPSPPARESEAETPT